MGSNCTRAKAPPPYAALPPQLTNLRRLAQHVRRGSPAALRASLAALCGKWTSQVPEDHGTVHALAHQALALASVCGADARIELVRDNSVRAVFDDGTVLQL